MFNMRQRFNLRATQRGNPTSTNTCWMQCFFFLGGSMRDIYKWCPFAVFLWCPGFAGVLWGAERVKVLGVLAVSLSTLALVGQFLFLFLPTLDFYFCLRGITFTTFYWQFANWRTPFVRYYFKIVTSIKREKRFWRYFKSSIIVVLKS